MEHHRRRTDRTRAGDPLAAIAPLAAVALVIALLGAAGGLPHPRADAAVSADGAVAMPAADTAASTGLIAVTVTRVVDGDTVHVRRPDGADETVRLIGVDTPESTNRHDPYGSEASEYTKRRLQKGATVWLELDVRERDPFGRLLAYVWLEIPRSRSAAEVRAKMFNAELLVGGYAQLMTVAPDVGYADVFAPLQAEARDAGSGLWGLPAK